MSDAIWLLNKQMRVSELGTVEEIKQAACESQLSITNILKTTK